MLLNQTGGNPLHDNSDDTVSAGFNDLGHNDAVSTPPAARSRQMVASASLNPFENVCNVTLCELFSK